MENNLDDFFKNKLNDLNSSDDGWDEPSESVWANAQPNFPTYGKSKRNWLVVLAVLLGLSLLGTGTYLYKIKQENNALKQKIVALNTTKSADIKQEESSKNALIRQNETLQSQLSELQSTLEEEQKNTQQTVKNLENACDVSINKAIENNTKKYQNIIQQQQTRIKQLENENQSLKSTNATLRQQPIATKTDETTDNQINESNELLNNLLNNKSFLVESNTTKSITSPILEQPKKAWKKYEFGLDLASVGFNVELTNFVENTDNFQSVPITNAADNLAQANAPNYSVSNAPSFGFHFGYGIKEDFYVRTGMRYANFDINNTYASGIVYDQSSEYINNQGLVLNDLVLNSVTPFNNLQQGVTVEIPNGTSLTSNDVVQSTLSNSQNYHFVQVPLGIAYYRGKRRLQMEFQGGFTWNMIRFNDYTFDAAFRANGVNLPINDSKLLSNTVNTSTYLGGYLGIGANYRLSNSWHIRAGVTLEETGLRTNTQSFSRRYLLESGMNLSLNYRF